MTDPNPPEGTSPGESSRAGEQPGDPPPAAGWQQPGPYPPQQGYYYPPPPPPGYPPGGYYATGYPPAYPAPGSGARPGRVLAAAIITWVFSTLVLLLGAVILIAAASGSEAYYRAFLDEANGFSRQDAKAVGVITGVVLVFWCLCAIILAAVMLLRHNWARIALTVSCAGTLLFSLLAILSIVPVVTIAAAVAVIVLMYGGEAGQWFSRVEQSYPQVPGGQPVHNPTTHDQHDDPNQSGPRVW